MLDYYDIRNRVTCAVARVYSSLTLFVFTGDNLSHFTDAHELARLYHINLPALTHSFHNLP